MDHSTDPIMSADLAMAQADMRRAYWHGAFGVAVSGWVWIAAAMTAAFGKPQQAVWVLLIGGMFIFPVSMAMAKIAGRSGMHDKANPLGGLAAASTFGLLFGCAIALGVATLKLEWFFPTMLLVIGGRYLVFPTVYGLRIYWVCGLVLAAAGLLLGALLAGPAPEWKLSGPFLAAVTGGFVETVFATLLFRQGYVSAR